MSLRHHTSGNDRPWQFRPSDHLLGQRRHIYGAIMPMDEPGFFERIIRRFLP